MPCDALPHYRIISPLIRIYCCQQYTPPDRNHAPRASNISPRSPLLQHIYHYTFAGPARTNRIVPLGHGLGAALHEEGGEVLAPGQVRGRLGVPAGHLHSVQDVTDQ